VLSLIKSDFLLESWHEICCSAAAEACQGMNTVTINTIRKNVLFPVIRNFSTHKTYHATDFRSRKAVILTKVSRYEFEKLRHANLSEHELQDELTGRGSNYGQILHHHSVHKEREGQVVSELAKAGIETRVVSRGDYNDEVIKWADLIVTTGGDGTFLMAASKVLDRGKPVVGFNTDPARSEGHLCLPNHFSDHVARAVHLLTTGSFRWTFRNRLRITLVGELEKISATPLELHSQKLEYPEYRFLEVLGMHQEEEEGNDHPFSEARPGSRPASGSVTLPVRALNEIYIGESLSSRVSYLDIQVDQEESFKTRNSGLCIATGTGSTSWLFNINKLTHHAVECLLKATFEVTRFPLNWKDSKLVESVASKFNRHLVFDPASPFLCYTLRDPVSRGTFPAPDEHKPRGKEDLRPVQVLRRVPGGGREPELQVQ